MKDFLSTLGIKEINAGTATGKDFFKTESAEKIASYTPVDGSEIAEVFTTTRDEYDIVVKKSRDAFRLWRMTPAPRRGRNCTANRPCTAKI
jgi:aldehyde dehydrogenase (NAD+)